MKVLYLIGGLNTGGKERLLLDVLQLQDGLPFEAFCIYRKSGNLETQYRNALRNTFHLPSRNVVGFLLRLRRIIKRGGIRLVHAQSSFDSLLAAVASLGMGVRIVQTVHSYEFARTGWSSLLDRMAFRLCSRIVFVSQQQLNHYASVYHLSPNQREKQSVVYNGINFSRFSLMAHARTGRLNMAMVGNFVPEKDQYFVCRFLERLHGSGVDFDFYFVGARNGNHPECYDRCIAYCEQHRLNDCVHFLGGCDDVPGLLGKMDAFVYSSMSETFGIAVVEAIATGLPTFVNDLDVLCEITRQGKWAVLYRSGDLDDLCNRFADFINDADAYYASAKENAVEVRNLYSINRHVENLKNIYLQILSL